MGVLLQPSWEGVPDHATRWDMETHAYSIDPAYQNNTRIIAFETPHPGNPGTGSKPVPLQEVPRRRQRSMHSHTQFDPAMRRREAGGRGMRMLYWDDNGRASCMLPCANYSCPYDAVCGQYVDNIASDVHDRHRCSGCVADARDAAR